MMPGGSHEGCTIAHLEFQGKLQLALISEALVMAPSIATTCALRDMYQIVHNSLVAIIGYALQGEPFFPSPWQHCYQPVS